MKSGYDGKRAVQNHTGLGNYSRYVIEALNDHYPQQEYLLYAPKRRENPRLDALLQDGNGRISLHFPKGWWRRLSALWRIYGMRKQVEKDGVALFHGLSNELPLNIQQFKGVKSIVTIHDLIFLRLPHCYKTIDRLIYNYKFRRACQYADRIIAVSECTKRDITLFYGIAEEKIEVIYQGCDPAFSQQVDDEKKAEVSKRYHLPEKFILSVGTIEERKNTLLAVEALEKLPEEYHLVLVGKETPYAQKIKEYIKQAQLEKRVHLLQGVPFADLPAIYQCATTFVYPSVYEGFGIPILEALNSRLPVVAATGSCLEEAGGPHSLYVPPTNASLMAEAIKETLQPSKRERMVEEGNKWAARFTKEQMARQTMKCYERVLMNEN